MTDKLDLQTLVRGYERNMKALDLELTKLEGEAETIRGQLEGRKAARANLDALSRQRAALQEERESLRGTYAEASFESDTAALQRITKRREEIDRELEQVEEGIRAERASMPSVDSQHAASIAVAKDMLRPIKIEDFIKKLTVTLQDDAKAINDKIRSINVPSSAYSREDYDKQRSSVDASYAIQLSKERRLAEEDRKRREKMRPVSSTDQMHSIQSKRPQPTVTSGDDTGALSGDEVRRILREKQTA